MTTPSTNALTPTPFPAFRLAVVALVAMGLAGSSEAAWAVTPHQGKGSRITRSAIHAARIAAKTEGAPATGSREIRTTGCPPAAAASLAPAETKAVPAGPEADFIDTGVLEGTDILEQGLEIAGILTDDMVSRFGHELFDVFNRHWKPPEGVSYNLVFSELTDPFRGSLATIKLNDQVIFEGPLAPREDVIQELGKSLARDIRNLLRNTAKLEEEEYY